MDAAFFAGWPRLAFGVGLGMAVFDFRAVPVTLFAPAAFLVRTAGCAGAGNAAAVTLFAPAAFTVGCAGAGNAADRGVFCRQFTAFPFCFFFFTFVGDFLAPVVALPATFFAVAGFFFCDVLGFRDFSFVAGCPGPLAVGMPADPTPSSAVPRPFPLPEEVVNTRPPRHSGLRTSFRSAAVSSTGDRIDYRLHHAGPSRREQHR